MSYTRGDWFSELFGFIEGRRAQEVKERLRLSDDGRTLTSTINGQSFRVGTFSTPTLGELREKALRALDRDPARAKSSGLRSGRGCVVSNVLGDVAEFHRQSENRLATFQVASQFNCLEFVAPSVTPEHGVTGYVNDRTQGPCCAIACGAATVYRNYFAPVHDASGSVVQTGQTAKRQIENLREVGMAIQAKGPKGCFPQVVGGYTLASDHQLRSLNRWMSTLDLAALDDLRQLLRIGVQEDAQVTSYSWGRCQLRDPHQLVTQVFGSACSVNYSRNSSAALWEPLARLVLQASYEATLWVTVLAALRHDGAAGSRKVFLTALGGGVFGNDMRWIAEAMREALCRIEQAGVALEVNLVSYAPPVDPRLLPLTAEFRGMTLPTATAAGVPEPRPAVRSRAASLPTEAASAKPASGVAHLKPQAAEPEGPQAHASLKVKAAEIEARELSAQPAEPAEPALARGVKRPLPSTPPKIAEPRETPDKRRRAATSPAAKVSILDLLKRASAK